MSEPKETDLKTFAHKIMQITEDRLGKEMSEKVDRSIEELEKKIKVDSNELMRRSFRYRASIAG